MKRQYAYLLLLLLLTVSCGQVGRKQTTYRPRIKVETVVAGLDNDPGEQLYIGEIASLKSTTLTAPYPGTLQQLSVQKGAKVAKGQVVAVIRSGQVESALRIARATRAQARDAYDRVSAVYSEGGISELQMVDVRTQLEKAEAALAAAESTRSDGTVRAPFAGVVTDVYPHRGEEMTLLQPLLAIHDLSGQSVRFSVHENEIGSIRVGTKATVDIPALGLEGLRAVVSEKDMLTSALSHSYACRLLLDQPPAGLMPGMSVRVHIARSLRSDLLIPAAAVQLDNDGKYVWLNDKGTVRKARITVGGFAGKGVIVTEGLEPGDRVITRGYQKVSTGMKVIE